MDTVLQFLAGLGSVLSQPAIGGTLVVMTGLLLADFLTGVTAAFRDGDFEAAYLPMFLQTHIIGAWVPVIGLVLLAPFTPPLVVVAGLAVTAYAVSTLASIRSNLRLPRDGA